MTNNHYNHIQEELEKKAEKKENRKDKMKISGQSVRKLAKIIKEKGQKKS
ncbi:MAG: hypothetical protein PHN19_02360 [Patescibacteria group bacterium]|nr:hypothetical protein [Patescibacteria group bacterium]